jgi:tetratricopeptide (TPR) repeat protein
MIEPAHVPTPLPAQAAALLSQADQAYRAGGMAQARALATQACEAAPRSREPWLMRADIGQRMSDMGEMELALGRAAALTAPGAERRRFELHRAWALHTLGRLGETYAIAKALAAGPWEPAEGKALGALLDSAGLSEAALGPILAAAAITPDSADSWYDAALVHRSLGDAEAAVAAAERAVALDPDLGPAYGLLAGLRRWTPARNHVQALQAALGRASTPLNRARIGYGLFKELDDLGETGRAWSAVEAAGAAGKAAFPWAADRDRASVDVLRRMFPDAPTATPARPPAAGPRPVFVVGLPRSGTTLVERVLAAHSQVTALGELNAFGVLADPRPDRKPWPYADLDAMTRLANADWSRVGDAYRAQVALMAEGRAVTVDKNPQNWVFAGAIARALPDAVIVHVSRAPMDSLFGAYKQLFLREHAWSFDLADLAAHYRHYLDLTGHWRAQLGARWVDVSYDDLARDPEAVAPPLLSAVGLGMEPACLAPETAHGGVRTLSSIQVREPINTRSIGGWRRYAHGLEPLRAALQDAGVVDADGEAA